MAKLSRLAYLCFIALWVPCVSLATDTTAVDKIIQFPDRLFSFIDKKSNELSGKIQKRAEKFLRRLERSEQALLKKIAKQDSTLYRSLQGTHSYKSLLNADELTSDGSLNLSGEYLPSVDSIQGLLNFIKSQPQLFPRDVVDRAKQSLGRYQNVFSNLRQAEKIKSLISERKQRLTELFQSRGALSAGLLKDFRKYKEHAYYYTQEVQRYREILNDPVQLQQKALALLNKIPAFAEFMKKNSLIAGLFNVPTDWGSASISGLQTRSQVQQMIQTQVGQGGMQQFNQAMAAGQSQLSSIRDRIRQLGGSEKELEIPDFKPNNERTKTFLQRIEVGANLQTTKSSTFFPTTTDLGLSLGYRFSSKSIAGIGASYKLGLRKDFRNIRLTHEGVGVRSFVDIKLKGSFWISGGAELNYRAQFRSFDVLSNYSAWQQSALLGVSKKYSIGKKWKGKMQLLYDFLHKQQVPVTQALVYRLGYNL
jgi:hypothetical protein